MLRLSDIMTTEVLTVTPDTSLRTAMELFSTHHISGAPVMEGSRVVGVISANDILALASAPPQAPYDRGTVAEERSVWPTSPGWDGDDADGYDPEGPEGDDPYSTWSEDDEGAGTVAGSVTDQEWDTLAEHTVADAMTWGVYALPPAASVAAAAECMRTASVHRMLVIDEGRLVGIVTTMDLVRAVAEHRIVRRTFVFDRAGGRG